MQEDVIQILLQEELVGGGGYSANTPRLRLCWALMIGFRQFSNI